MNDILFLSNGLVSCEKTMGCWSIGDCVKFVDDDNKDNGDDSGNEEETTKCIWMIQQICRKYRINGVIYLLKMLEGLGAKKIFFCFSNAWPDVTQRKQK